MSPLNPLNPASGDVPVPEDAREIDAALRAGRITHRIFPYFSWRYGERGRKFTQSDSAWLAWLVRHDQAKVNEQIQWLRAVLSNRGMPSWILEIHLQVMHKQLVRAAPAKEADFDKLAHCAALLKAQRHEVLSDQVGGELAQQFALDVDNKPTRILVGTGRLLVAAVTDERMGIKHTVKAVEDWLTDRSTLRNMISIREVLSAGQRKTIDSTGFSSKWNEAVTLTIERARNA